LVETLTFDPDFKILKFLKGLNNSLRIKIVELILNNSSFSFTQIHEYLEEQTGRTINKGTIVYHLDILVQSNILNKKLARNQKDRTYSNYSVTDYTKEKLKSF
jgi:predicted transcriptional regulator